MLLRRRQILTGEENSPYQHNIANAAQLTNKDQQMLNKMEFWNVKILVGRNEFLYQANLAKKDIEVRKKNGFFEKDKKMSAVLGFSDVQNKCSIQEAETNAGMKVISPIQELRPREKFKKNTKENAGAQKKPVLANKKNKLLSAMKSPDKIHMPHNDASKEVEKTVACSLVVQSDPLSHPKPIEMIEGQSDVQEKRSSGNKKLILRFPMQRSVVNNIVLSQVTTAKSSIEKMCILRQPNREAVRSRNKKRTSPTIGLVDPPTVVPSKEITLDNSKSSSKSPQKPLSNKQITKLPKNVALPEKKGLSATIGFNGHLRKPLVKTPKKGKLEGRNNNEVQAASKEGEIAEKATSKKHFSVGKVTKGLPIIERKELQEKRKQPKVYATNFHRVERRNAIAKEQSIISQIFSQDNVDVIQQTGDTTSRHSSHVYDANCNICGAKDLETARKELYDAKNQQLLTDMRSAENGPPLNCAPDISFKLQRHPDIVIQDVNFLTRTSPPAALHNEEYLDPWLKLMTVTEVAGDHGCGKLDLAMTIIAEMLLSEEKKNWRAVILDYSGTFRTSKLLGIIRCRSNIPESDRIALLDRVYIERVYTPDELEISFRRMIEEFEDKSVIPLVILNDVGAILSDTSFMEEHEAGLIQDRILKRMREFCTLCGGAVISFNHVVNWRGFPTAALGNIWINAPIITKRIILTRSGVDGSLCAQLETKNSVEGKRVPYVVTDKGFCAVAIQEPAAELGNSRISDQ